MATRTARGTASSKTSGTTLTIPSFTVPAGHSLIVGAAYANGSLAPDTVEHAGRTLRRKIQQDNATRSIHASMWLKGEYHKEQTGTCVITWGSAIVEKAAFASSLDIAVKEDDAAGSSDTTTTQSPATGRTGALITAGAFVVGTKYEITSLGTTNFTLIGAASNTVGLTFTATGVGSGTGQAREALDSTESFAFAVFGGEGPVEDTQGTVQIRDNGSLASATMGQRAGTTGGAAPSNIFVQEAYLELSTDHFTRGLISSATSRRWVNCILAVEQRRSFINSGITPTDVAEAADIIADAGGNSDNAYFGFNEDTGIWELYEIASPGSVIATSPGDGVWTTS